MNLLASQEKFQKGRKEEIESTEGRHEGEGKKEKKREQKGRGDKKRGRVERIWERRRENASKPSILVSIQPP